MRKAHFYLHTELNKVSESKRRKEHLNVEVDKKGCTELILLKTDMLIPGVNYTFEAEIDYTLYDTPFDNVEELNMLKFNLLKGIIVLVSTKCPPGFQSTPSSNGTVCVCNQILLNRHFKCTITTRGIKAEITYKSPANNYWMGYLGHQLVFSDHCPPHYCNTVNSIMSTSGLRSEDINTTIQCDPNSNRKGLLCSQCTPGTSSQFGSFRCTQCTYAGRLLVPLLAVAGIVLIILLFLFNFTVLQGDIIGIIVFYANIVGIMDEFLLKYSIRPFYIFLALINFGFGFETCFFDGMDEFSKAIIQFIFPFYLIALLIHHHYCCSQIQLEDFQNKICSQEISPSTGHYHAAHIFGAHQCCHLRITVHTHVPYRVWKSSSGLATSAGTGIL